MNQLLSVHTYKVMYIINISSLVFVSREKQHCEAHFITKFSSSGFIVLEVVSKVFCLQQKFGNIVVSL